MNLWNKFKMAEGSSANDNKGRKDYMRWQDYFMAVAILVAKRSDSISKVGAAIVNPQKQIVSTGYTKVTTGAEDLYSKAKNDDKKLYMSHAPINAILNKDVPDLHGCSIYVGHFPCNECVKMIIQSGIKKIHYLSENSSAEIEAAKRMLHGSGLKYYQFQYEKPIHMIDFTKIEPKPAQKSNFLNLLKLNLEYFKIFK